MARSVRWEQVTANCRTREGRAEISFFFNFLIAYSLQEQSFLHHFTNLVGLALSLQRVAGFRTEDHRAARITLGMRQGKLVSIF